MAGLEGGRWECLSRRGRVSSRGGGSPGILFRPQPVMLYLQSYMGLKWLILLCVVSTLNSLAFI